MGRWFNVLKWADLLNHPENWGKTTFFLHQCKDEAEKSVYKNIARGSSILNIVFLL
jgi:hypothetical protein